jgi:cell wall-associated NlpC family hydrolase
MRIALVSAASVTSLIVGLPVLVASVAAGVVGGAGPASGSCVADAAVSAPFLTVGEIPRIGVRYQAAATVFGPPGQDATTNDGHDAQGRVVNLTGYHWAFAELAGPAGLGSAMGGLARGTRLRVTNPRTGRSVIVAKWDVGFGGGPVDGQPRLVDLWYAAAAAIGQAGSGIVLVERLAGLAASPNDAAHGARVGPDAACRTIVASPGDAPGVRAVQAAFRYLGTPYVWGGGDANGPTRGTCVGYHGPAPCRAAVLKGFDCSGLAQYAWAQAGVRLPRVTTDQWHAGRHLAARYGDRAVLQPGDLVFFTTDGAHGHVALWVGVNWVIDAPHTGAAVEMINLAASPWLVARWEGAVRPAVDVGGRR